MKAFRRMTGRVAVLDRTDVDTDQIVAKQALMRVDRTGFGRFLFYDWRVDADGNPRPEFELNNPAFAGAKILLAGRNFGCGSSREHAPWALLDFGIRCVIAPSFADIFFNNCVKNGILLITMPTAAVEALQAEIAEPAKASLAIDLPKQEIRRADGSVIAFEIDPARKHRLLNGLDDIGLTLEKVSAISGFEAKQRAAQPWLYR